MKRRVILFVCLLLAFFPLDAQVNIWESTSCHKKVKLTPYIPKAEPLAAVVVCPGGSYFWHDLTSEGSMVGEWLSSKGIAAYVLEYRVAGFADFISGYRFLFRGNRHPDMINDLQRSISLVREDFNGPVGVMGFSAGGHLALSSGILPGSSLRPDFIAAVYPVISLSDEEIVHKRSRRGLLGENRINDAALRDALSLEKNVSQSMPPVFLVNCIDDPTVDYRNSAVMYEALQKNNVPSLYLQFKTGGHGFGANPQKMNDETSLWQDAFIDWLSSII